MTRTLVTGGAGFIGSHVARHCLQMGHEVVALDDLSGGFRDHVPAAAEFVKGSVTDQALIERLFHKHRFDYVYHLAAYAAEGLSHFIRHFNYTNNVLGSINLINASVKYEVKCFVFTSSIAVYGSAPPPMDENTAPRPEDPYGIAKYAVELDLKAAHEMFGLPYVIFRPHNVYGEHQNLGDRYRNVIGIFMNQIMQDKPLTVFGDGSQTRAFSYIDDVAPYIAKSPEVRETRGQIINIGADQPYSVNELAKVIGAAFGKKPQIQYLPPRLEVLHAFAEHVKAKTIFGYSSTVDLELGVEKMAAWARQAGVRKSRKFSQIELAKNLPKVWEQP